MTTETTLDRRSLLLAAATMLAERLDPLGLTEEELAQAVGLSLDEFSREFDGVEAYLSAAQLQFFEGRLSSVIARAGSMHPGFDRIRTADRYQRLGLGSALMRALATEARQSGVEDAMLCATPAGRELYTSLGWSLHSDYTTASLSPAQNLLS